MGATWDGKPSGTFGRAACFSTQSFKHANSGEGGLLTTDDEDLAARAILLSGAYMLYEQHGARWIVCDMRIPLAMSSEQADQIVAIIARAVAEAVG